MDCQQMSALGGDWYCMTTTLGCDSQLPLKRTELKGRSIAYRLSLGRHWLIDSTLKPIDFLNNSQTIPSIVHFIHFKWHTTKARAAWTLLNKQSSLVMHGVGEDISYLNIPHDQLPSQDDTEETRTDTLTDRLSPAYRWNRWELKRKVSWSAVIPQLQRVVAGEFFI